MSVRSPSSTKKYSARALAAGSAFCPACRRLTDRDAEFCPSCGFMGEHTMSIFPVSAPPLDEIGDHAGLFEPREKEVIQRAIQAMRKRFPQIQWKIVTANLERKDATGLFAFWLLNVSPLGSAEKAGDRRWTVLIVITPTGEIAFVPGYSVEVWLSGQDWTQLIRTLHSGIRRRGYVSGIQGFLEIAEKKLEQSWRRMRGKIKASKDGREEDR